jgi:hypothetical protein
LFLHLWLDDVDQMVTHLNELGIETGEQMKSEQTKVIIIKFAFFLSRWYRGSPGDCVTIGRFGGR